MSGRGIGREGCKMVGVAVGDIPVLLVVRKVEVTSLVVVVVTMLVASGESTISTNLASYLISTIVKENKA